MGVVMRRGIDGEREGLCVVKNSPKQRGGDEKVKYINNVQIRLIGSVIGELFRQLAGGYTVFISGYQSGAQAAFN